MGLAITSIGKGSPGERSVPGDTFTNKQLLAHLKKGLNFWQRAGLWIAPSQIKKAERALVVLERKTGVKQRQMMISDTLYPNELLGTAAALDAIAQMKKKNPKFTPKDIHGFVLVTDTRDSVFPVSGKIIAKSLGIRPMHFANASLACSSVVNAFWQACSMMEYDEDCKYVLVVASDVTSRLHQPTAKKQPFLFGDQAVAFILEKTNGKGGIKVSNISLDVDAPDIFHAPLFTGDTPKHVDRFHNPDFGNDWNLKLFGEYEAKSIAGLYRYYLATQVGGNNGTVSSNGDTHKEMFIVPQVSLNILNEGAKNAEVDCSDYEGRLVRNTVLEHGITGAAGTPLAMYYLNQTNSLSDTPFTAFISAIGGLNAMFTYDPSASKLFDYGFKIIPGSLIQGKSSGEDGTLPDMNVQIVKSNGHTNGLAEPEHWEIDVAANEIISVLGNSPEVELAVVHK
ncbi:MAG: hypothetical protein HYR97_08865 [Candidatus Melainabacteria bacterium]|nr:hypothetical protein [Candidatus Melainabacteria bacterium]MBI3308950.1 hypothetical protein [Candidatus Melainabacteria bacterium]